MAVCVPVEPVATPVPRDRVELVLTHLDRLPTLPAVAVRLLAVTSSSDSCAGDVVRVIQSDAAMTAAILRMVRRADLGVRGEAMTVERAVSLLGFAAVRNAVLSIQLVQTFAESDTKPPVRAVRRELWRHNIAVACASELIGQHLGGSAMGGEAFVCGLLHDLGKVALDACLPKTHARVRELVERRFACICDVESELLGLDHTVAGRHLALRWGLPTSVVECIWLHHQSPESLPSSLTAPQHVRIVHLADNLARRDGLGYSGYQYVGDVDELAAGLGLTSGDVQSLLDRLPPRMASIAELVGLDAATDPDEYTASVVAANRQLGCLNARLTQSHRVLELRSECFAAVERFNRELHGQDRIAEVCSAAARTVCAWLGVERAMAIHLEETSGRVQFGSADDSEAEPTEPPGPVDTAELSGGPPIPVIPSVPGLMAAGEGFETIWQRRFGPAAHAPLWLLPLPTTHGARSAVVAAASEPAISRFLAAPQPCAALAAAIGNVLASASVRLEAERMSEELVDVNRRLREAQGELVRNRSVKMIAAMAAGAAHEMNNPLAVISGRAQMELGRCEGEESTKTFEIIVAQTKRATQIVNDLMTYAKPAPPTPIVQNLADLFDMLCQHWRKESDLLAQQLTCDPADPDTTVYCDTMQLRDMLDAAVRNAVEATDPETRCVKVNSVARASDETVRIVVEDNGIGMTRDVLDHAIDPFFSSRPAGRGRGLGLSRAFRLAEVNGGRLWLSSQPGVGTTVSIELPARAPGT